ncbi:siderophore-interacting protein [Streptomyces sp. NBC_00859]|nr:siderophore-interacting protein [Streptomyces sp. NBC_00859]
MAASVERLPKGAQAIALLEVDNPSEEQSIDAPAAADVTWLHRGHHPAGASLVTAVHNLSFPTGELQALVHGEANFVREIRRHLLLDRGVHCGDISASGYWRLGPTGERWRASHPRETPRP